MFKVVLILVFLLTPLVAFNNCGRTLSAAKSEESASPATSDILSGTDAGNPVPYQLGNEILGLSGRLCAKIESCTGQVIQSCTSLIYTATLPGVSQFMGAPEPATSLFSMQTLVDQGQLKVNLTGLAACYSAIDNLSCAVFPADLSQDYLERNVQLAAIVNQITECQNIVAP